MKKVQEQGKRQVKLYLDDKLMGRVKVYAYLNNMNISTAVGILLTSQLHDFSERVDSLMTSKKLDNK